MSTLSIPAFHISDKSKVKGFGEVYIASRDDANTNGTFSLEINVEFDPSSQDYPTGSLAMKVNLSDGSNGSFQATTIELINSYGKHNPTVVLTGQCKDSLTPDPKGCRYWIMIVNNKNTPQGGTPDILGFAIHDKFGEKIT
jgi:hypothetical protein